MHDTLRCNEVCRPIEAWRQDPHIARVSLSIFLQPDSFLPRVNDKQCVGRGSFSRGRLVNLLPFAVKSPVSFVLRLSVLWCRDDYMSNTVARFILTSM